MAVAGRIASGKSTIARHLAERIGATLLVADRIRDEAVEALAREAGPGEVRQPALVDDAVYRELLGRAGDVLAAGRSVVLDASFPTRALRDEARALAALRGARFLLVECRAGDAAVRSRLAARAASGRVAFGRWLALRDAFDAGFEAPGELPPADHLQLDTSGAAADSAAAALAWLAVARGE